LAVALIVAAGRGERLGAGQPKALAALAGRPMVQWCIDALRAVAAIERIVVALPSGVALAAAMLEGGCGPEAAVGGGSLAGREEGCIPERVVGVEGGSVRSESVRLALAAAGGGGVSDLVLVHDAARPLLSPQLAERVLAAVAPKGVDAAIAAAPVTDTVKRVGEGRVVRETLDRSELWAVQTPQVFRRPALERALDVPHEVLAQATDDAWLIERAGGTVVVVEAPRENLKVTTPLDFALAELLLVQRGPECGRSRGG
jgi:2-C-methyl-D-erythritol 4-phosphate cytidylyltransferase